MDSHSNLSHPNFSVSFDSDRVSGSDSCSDSYSSVRAYPLEPHQPFSHGDREFDLGLDVITESMDDLDSWVPKDNNNVDDLSSYMGELGSGFEVEVDEVELPRNEARADGLRVSRVDTELEPDAGGEIVDLSAGGDEPGSPGLWDSFIDNHMGLANPNEGFEWDELEQAIDESESLSMAIDRVEESLIPSSSISAVTEDEEPMDDIERELLMAFDDNVNSIEDSYMFDADYDTLMEQLADSDVHWRGSPPAAKTVVKNLPLVVLGKEDFAVCAICKDEVEEGEMVNKLPCGHYYHGDCIVPWLRMRSTCPVCRYELPTDEEDYESRKRRRTGY